MTTVSTVSFDSWMRRVNATLFRKYGFDADTCEDYEWEAEWSSGSSPETAIEAAESYWGADAW